MPTTLAMIVRNEEANLPACLESVRGLFADTVIVDTGSTDDTIKIARRFGARVFRFAWCDDFAAARNFGLDRVHTDYWFRLDADDRLHGGSRKRLAALLGRISRPEAYACPVHSIEHTGREMICQEFRLFPRDCRFTGRIHERVRVEEYAPWLAVGPSTVRIDHVGYSDRETYYAKLKRNYAILLEESKLPRVDSLTWFDLGRTESALGYHNAALGSIELFLSMPGRGQDAARRVAYRCLVETHRELRDLRAAHAAAERGLREYPDDITLLTAIADIHYALGDLEIAAEGYERSLVLPDRLDSVIPAGYRRDTAAALAATRHAIRTRPRETPPAPPREPGAVSLSELLAM